MDWMNELDKVQVNTPEQYELIDRTKEFLKANTDNQDDLRYLNYYKKLISNFNDKDFAAIVLKIVYKHITFKSPESVIESFEIYKEQDVCKEVKDMYKMSIGFIRALVQEPEKLNTYALNYLGRVEKIVEKSKLGTIGTYFDRLHIANIIIDVNGIIDLYV